MRWKDIVKYITSLTLEEITAINDTSNSICEDIYDNTCRFVFVPEYVDEGKEAWECTHCGNVWITYDEWKHCPECGYEILSYDVN